MATFKITANSTVKSFSKAFKEEFGATLQIYNGRLCADESVKLVDLGVKTGTFECRSSRTVGSFVKMMQDEFNMKVKVRTTDDWVTVIDGLTLNRINDLPKQTTKTVMENYVSYQRKDTKSEEKAAPKDGKTDNYEVRTDAQVITLDLPNADGLYPDRDFDKSGYWNGYRHEDSEEWAIEPNFEDANDFSEGVAAVQDKEGNYGFINAKGEYVIAPQFLNARDFKDGIAPVQNKDEKWGYINLNGEWIVKPVFDSQIYWSTNDNTKEVTVNGKKGIIRRDYSWLIPPLYDYLKDTKNELYKAKYNDKYGLLNNKNEWIIKPTYEDIACNDGQTLLAQKDGKYGIMNLKEEWLIQPLFEDLDLFSEGLASALIDDKYGYINEKGDWVITPQFDKAYGFYNGNASVEYNGISLEIDKNGLIDGKTAEEYYNSNPTYKGWKDSKDLAAKTESVAVALHKVGDGYNPDVDNHDDASEDDYFFLTDKKGHFKVFKGEEWCTMEEFMGDNPEYDTIYYGDDYVISEKADKIYGDDEEWPTIDRTMMEAIQQTLEGENFNDFRYYYPSIDFDLIYNGEVIYSGNISD